MNDRYQLVTNKRRDVAMIFDTGKEPASILAVTQQTVLAYRVTVEMNEREREQA